MESFYTFIGHLAIFVMVGGLIIGAIWQITEWYEWASDLKDYAQETLRRTNYIDHDLRSLKKDFDKFAEWVKSEDVDIDEAAEATK